MNRHYRLRRTWARTAGLLLVALFSVVAPLPAQLSPLPTPESKTPDASITDWMIEPAAVSIDDVRVREGGRQVYVSLTVRDYTATTIDLYAGDGRFVSRLIEFEFFTPGEQRVGFMLPRGLRSGSYTLTATTAAGSSSRQFQLRR